MTDTTGPRADIGAGMRSADIPDGMQNYPDVGTCPVCRARGRLKKDGTMRQHWRYGWPRRGGNPPCRGTGQQPSVLNEGRVTRYLAAQAGHPYLAPDVMPTVSTSPEDGAL